MKVSGKLVFRLSRDRCRWVFLAIIGLMMLFGALPYQNGDAEQSRSVEPTLSAKAENLTLKVEPLKQIFSSHEGLVMKFTWSAKAPVHLCLAKDLFSQIKMDISRSGVGKLVVQPLVTQDNSQVFQEPMQVYKLKAGESLTRRANLKRFKLGGGENWVPGEYTVKATFLLCEQPLPGETPRQDTVVTDPGQETPITTKVPGWFMIMI